MTLLIPSSFLLLSFFCAHSYTRLAATNSEVSERRNNQDAVRGSRIRNDAAVAVLVKGNENNDAKAMLCTSLPWGYGYGYSILPNGVWSGGK